jgi:hypothetical protein
MSVVNHFRTAILVLDVQRFKSLPGSDDCGDLVSHKNAVELSEKAPQKEVKPISCCFHPFINLSALVFVSFQHLDLFSFIMEQIVIYGGGVLVTRIAGKALEYLFNHAQSVYHRLVWFLQGGRRGAQRVYDIYKAARHEIQIMKGIDHDQKRYLIEDLKAEIMIRYPHLAYLFSHG